GQKPEQLQTLDSLRSLVSGRRILQHFKPLSTAFFTASDLDDRNPSEPSKTANSLINKRFIVSAAPEVGRIIE
ncbi:hypothetical protein, partial [Pseudomonas sp. CFBP 8758]|uniref:hypothetical protein n=1 Tax=Pseudomonas sp. CFBP 8758 TaxID=2775286 RepID=UPI001A90EA59